MEAAQSNSGVAKPAWEALARTYWPALYRYIRRRGYSHHEAEDLTQGFFARLLEKNVLREASQARGRFRSFLLASVTHFLANEFDRKQALKRGGAESFVSFDAAEFDLPSREVEEPPDKLFDRAWAEAILASAMTRLEGEFSTESKGAQFSALRPFLFRPPGLGEYEKVGTALGIRSSLVPTAVSRLRQRFRQLVRSEIGQTVAHLRDVDDELRYLVSLLSK